MTVQPNDEGVTVPELLVTVLIFSIISIVLFGFISHVTDVAAREEAHENAEKEALIVMRTVSQDLRAASTVVADPGDGAVDTCPAAGVYLTSPYSGFARCVKVVINEPLDGLADCPRTEVRYGLATDGKLRQDRVVWRLNAGTCEPAITTTAKVLMEDVTNTKVFTFFYAGKDVTAYSPVQSPVNADAIQIDLLKRYKTNSAPIDLTSTVSLRNKR